MSTKQKRGGGSSRYLKRKEGSQISSCCQTCSSADTELCLSHGRGCPCRHCKPWIHVPAGFCLESGLSLRDWSPPAQTGIPALTSYRAAVGSPCPLAMLPPCRLVVSHAKPLQHQSTLTPCILQSSSEEGWPDVFCNNGAVPSRCQALTSDLRGNLKAQTE